MVCAAVTTNVIKFTGCVQVHASTKEAVVCVAVTTNVIKFAGCGQVPRKQWYA